MYCPKCEKQVREHAEIQVKVWQIARGSYSEDDQKFYATDFETLFDTEQVVVGPRLLCGVCDDVLLNNVPVEWV